MLLMGGLLHAQINNPFASKGEMVASIVRSATVFQDNAVIDLDAKGKPIYILNASGRETIAVRYPGGKIRTVKVPCGDYKKL